MFATAFCYPFCRRAAYPTRQTHGLMGACAGPWHDPPVRWRRPPGTYSASTVGMPRESSTSLARSNQSPGPKESITEASRPQWDGSLWASPRPDSVAVATPDSFRGDQGASEWPMIGRRPDATCSTTMLRVGDLDRSLGFLHRFVLRMTLLRRRAFRGSLHPGLRGLRGRRDRDSVLGAHLQLGYAQLRPSVTAYATSPRRLKTFNRHLRRHRTKAEKGCGHPPDEARSTVIATSSKDPDGLQVELIQRRRRAGCSRLGALRFPCQGPLQPPRQPDQRSRFASARRPGTLLASPGPGRALAHAQPMWKHLLTGAVPGSPLRSWDGHPAHRRRSLCWISGGLLAPNKPSASGEELFIGDA